jgi:ERF superfamily
MKMSDQVNELATAFSKAQSSMKNASKDAKNPHWKSQYSTLAAVIEAAREPLAMNNLCFLQPCGFREDGNVIVETILLHSSGQWISSELIGKPVRPDPQAIGSLVSYFKRYGLQALLGIASADDDAEAATHPATHYPKEEFPRGNLPPLGPAPHSPKSNPPTINLAPIPPRSEQLYNQISDLFKKLTNNYADKQKLQEILKEINIEHSGSTTKIIQGLSDQDKMDIISKLGAMK